MLYKAFIFLLCILCCFYVYSYIDTCTLNIFFSDLNTDITNMNPAGENNDSGSGVNASGNNASGSPNPGGKPGWSPYHYFPSVREDGQSYPENNPSPSLVLETYDPTGNIPVQNDKQLGVLIDYRFNNGVRALSYSRWNISETFPSDSIVDKIAREKLFAHIYDHRSELPSAYAQLDIRSGTPKWDSVKVSSFLINSLNNSNS